MAKTIKKIMPHKAVLSGTKKVAAYARVSSGKDAMLHSLSAQISYYSEYIQKHSDWEYVGVYSDEAITGTRNDRTEFQRMIADCRQGKIDMIITKSISRFARNTVILLSVVRELKDLGISVFFEKEGIYSDSDKGEMVLTLLATVAQEESRAVSDNCKWRIRNGFQEGKPHNTTMLGYRYDNGKLVIEPEEAEIVRMIFSDYLGGMGRTAIMKKLNTLGIKTRFGNEWNENSVYYVLNNLAYTGDLLLQKTYISDHITKRKKVNNGELPRYQVKNCHEAIIDQDTFLKVQEEMKRRAQRYKGKSSSATYPFTGMITCGICGKKFKRKIANAGKYKRPVWICRTFNTVGKKACDSKQIPEDILMEITAKVLGTKEFDETYLKQKILSITIPEKNTIIYTFLDGHIVKEEWHNRSRKESWTDEMRKAASIKQKEKAGDLNGK